MEGVIFDPEKVVVNTKESPYRIDYFCLNVTDHSLFEKVRIKYDVKDTFYRKTHVSQTVRSNFKHIFGKNNCRQNSNRACFGSLTMTMRSLKTEGQITTNTVALHIKTDLNKTKKVHLSKEEIIRWTVLCKQYGFMPQSVPDNFIERNLFIVPCLEISMNKLLVYLSFARHIQEIPQYVRAILHMVDDLGMGFLVATAVASIYTIENSNHHVFPTSKPYGFDYSVVPDVNSENNNLDSINLAFPLALYKFMSGEDEERDKLKNFGAASCRTGFSIFTTLERVVPNLKSAAFIIKREHILNKRLEPILKGGDHKELSDYLEKLRRPVIKKGITKAKTAAAGGIK